MRQRNLCQLLTGPRSARLWQRERRPRGTSARIRLHVAFGWSARLDEENGVQRLKQIAQGSMQCDTVQVVYQRRRQAPSGQRVSEALGFKPKEQPEA